MENVDDGMTARPRRIGRGQSSAGAAFRTPEGFTLVEMLAVMGIILALMVLVVPAVSSLGGASAFTAGVAQMQDVIEEAHAAALANNTYVWVGFLQMPNPAGVGMAYIYSASGNTASFMPNSSQTPPTQPSLNYLNKPVVIPNIDIGTISATQITNPSRATVSVGQLFNSSNILQVTDSGNNVKTAQFSSSLSGATRTFVSGATQPFSAIMEITPSGQVLISSNTKYACIEIGLSRLNTAATKDVAVLQINAFTGRVIAFHP